jgi:protein-tyrosine phosphatase
LTVLAVCTGNVCRSPAVERLLRLRLGLDDSIVVASAGTNALVGHPIAEPMAELLAGLGAETSGFAARRLTPAMVAAADVVVALTRAHRSAVVTLHPAAVRRSFTLRELARLVARVDPSALDEAAQGPGAGARLVALLPLAAAQRSSGPVTPEADDVVDPWRRQPSVYRESVTQISPAVDVLARALVPAAR